MNKSDTEFELAILFIASDISEAIDNSQKIKNNNKIEVLSISSLMSEAIKRIANSNSVSDLFN